MPKTKSRKDQPAADVELAAVWSDPPVEEIGSPVRTISNKDYLRELAVLQVELVKLQEWIRQQGLKVAILFEGRDAAGKGGAIKTITLALNPALLPGGGARARPPSARRRQWYFQRYVPHLPAAGEMVLFDRSWYNRAGVERVMGFCTDEEYREFLRSCPEFERMLVRSGIMLVKYWFSVSDEEQERRFQGRIDDPTKRWKLSADGPRVARPLGRVLEGQGRDVRATPTSSRRPGTSSTPTTRSAPGSTDPPPARASSRTRT